MEVVEVVRMDAQECGVEYTVADALLDSDEAESSDSDRYIGL